MKTRYHLFAAPNRLEHPFGLICAFVATVVYFWTTVSINAQVDPTAVRFGIGGAYLFNQHRANFDTIPGIASCCRQQYGSSSSQGFGLSAFAEYPIVRMTDFATLSVGGRFAYFQGVGANLTATETVRIQGGNAVIRHELESRLNTLVFEPMLTMRYFKRLTASLGIQLGTFLQPTYQYRERILEPDNITYSNGERTLNASADVLSNVSPLQAALVGGLALELQVNRPGTILPTLEAIYSYPLTSIAQFVDWRIATLRLGVSLRYSPYRTTELTAEEIEQRYQDSLKQIQAIAAKAQAEAKEARKKELNAKIGELRPVYFGEIEGENDSTTGNVGGKLNVQLTPANFTLKVSSLHTTFFCALLPQIYFAENSASLPSRYKVFVQTTDTEKFSLENVLVQTESSSVEKHTLQLYYHILNIIGKRLQERQQARLTLRGFSTKSEQNSTQLALSRANSISSYLQDIWKIPSSRIAIEVSVLSATGKQSEEFRVELSSNDPAILQAVETRYTRKTVSPDGLELGLQISAGQGLKQWDIEISQLSSRESFTLHSFQGGSTYPEKYVWDIRRKPPISTEDISLKLSIDDATNNKFEAPIVSVKVQEVSANKSLQTYIVLPEQNNLHSSQLTTLSQVLSTQTPAVSPSNILNVRAKVAKGNTSFANILPASLLLNSKEPTLFDISTPEGTAYNKALILDVFRQMK